MSVHTLIWILILLFVVLSAVIRLRRERKFRYRETDDKKTGWRAKLSAFTDQLEQMAREGEGPEKAVAPAADMSWERIEPALAEAREPAPEIIPAAADAGAKTPAFAKPVIAEPDPEPPAPAAAPAAPAVPPEQSRPKPSSPGLRDLRRAVIWSEILAPPLALRNRE